MIPVDFDLHVSFYHPRACDRPTCPQQSEVTWVQPDGQVLHLCRPHARQEYTRGY